MNVTITRITSYTPCVMPTASGFDIAGTVEIEDDVFHFTAEKLDTDSYTEGVSISLFHSASHEIPINWGSRISSDDNLLIDLDDQWIEIQERMTQLLDEFDNFAYGQMKDAWTRAVADYNTTVGAP